MTCEWPVERSCLTALPDESDDGYALALAKRSRAEDTATLVLWALTGRRFGICPARVRPCPGANPVAAFGTTYNRLLWWTGTGWSTTGCGCSGRCVATGPGQVHLPGPVVHNDDYPMVITLGDTVLDESAYTVEGNVLYRTGGRAWPGQNLGQPAGEPGTWVVQYHRGEVVPPGGDLMAGVLAKEMAAACEGGTCRLPKTVVSVTRQGVTHQFDPTKILAAGYTGLPEVDQWVSALNPKRIMSAPVVL